VTRRTRRCRRLHCGRRRIVVDNTQTVTTTVIVTRQINQRRLDNFTRREVRRECKGTQGEARRECRQRVRVEVRDREVEFRRTALRACRCRGRARERCTRPDGTIRDRCFRRSASRCRRRCLRRACRTRARTECASNANVTTCVTTRVRRCRRLHCGRRRRVVVRETNTVVVRRQINQRSLNVEVRREVRRECKGTRGEERRECRQRVRVEVRDREVEFRTNALRACKCRSNARARCARPDGSIREECVTRRVNRCRRRCLRRACRARARSECQQRHPGTDEQSRRERRRCRERRFREYRRVHCDSHRRVAIVTVTTVTITRNESIRIQRAADRVAISRCGEAADAKKCRRQVRREVVENESNWRTTTLKACKCKSAARARCPNLGEECVTRHLNRCRRRCLRRACRARARTECATEGDVTTCVTTRVRRCRRLHCGERRRRVVVRERNTVIVVKREVDRRRLDREVRREVRRECKGTHGEARRECRREVRQEVRDREVEFRRISLNACKCRSEARRKCADRAEGERVECRNKHLSRCRRRCLRRACKTRATNECAIEGDVSRCVTRRTTACRRVHCGRATVTVVNVTRVSTSNSTFQQRVQTIATTRAQRTCHGDNSCVTTTTTEVVTTENTWRTATLKSCKCRSHANEKCKRADNTVDQECHRKTRRTCRRRCLRRGCDVRARNECRVKFPGADEQARTNRKACRTRRVGRCRRLHCPRRGTVQVVIVRQRDNTNVVRRRNVEIIRENDRSITVTQTQGQTVVITRIVDISIVEEFATRQAWKKCTRGDQQCIDAEKKRIIDREVSFRRSALRGCKCRSRASAKCKRPDGSVRRRCARRAVRRCRHRCLRRACRERARKSCSTLTEGRRACRRSRARRCRRLHCRTSRRFQRWFRVARREARKQCGRGDAQRECRRNFIIQFFQIETSWRSTTVNGCSCVKFARTKCVRDDGSVRRRCYRRRFRRCSRRCTRKGCQARARTECTKRFPGADEQTIKRHARCSRRRTRRCRRLHSRSRPPVTIGCHF